MKWYWGGCGHKSYINDGGQILCKMCPGKKHFVRDVSFKCNDINHGNEYEIFSQTNFSFAVAIVTSGLSHKYSMDSSEQSKFLNNILAMAMKMYEKK